MKLSIIAMAVNAFLKLEPKEFQGNLFIGTSNRSKYIAHNKPTALEAFVKNERFQMSDDKGVKTYYRNGVKDDSGLVAKFFDRNFSSLIAM